MSRRLYIKSDGQELGPATVEEIRSLMEGGWVSPTDSGRWEDEDAWKTVESLLKPLPQSEGDQVTATDATPKMFKVLLSEQPVRNYKIKRAALACIAVVVGLGLIAFFSLWKSETGTQTVKSEQQTNRVASQPIAPAPQVPIPTNRPSPAIATVATNTAKTAPKPAAIPMIPTVSVQSSQTAPMPAIKMAATRRQVVTTGEVKGVGEYDAVLIRKVQKRWLDLVERARIGENRTGRVVLAFQLRSNGLVDRVRVQERDTDEFLGFLCESAVVDSAPFTPWPTAMRRTIQSDARSMQFTFRY